VAVTAVLVPFVHFSTRLWAERAQGQGRHLKVLEVVSLGSDGRLYLVEVAGQAYAVLGNGRGFQVLAQVEVPEAPAAAREGEGAGGTAWPLPGRLARWLAAGAFRWRWPAGPAEPVRTEAAAAFTPQATKVLAAQLERVRRLGMAEDGTLAVGKR
jgi:hypothetical protein